MLEQPVIARGRDAALFGGVDQTVDRCAQSGNFGRRIRRGAETQTRDVGRGQAFDAIGQGGEGPEDHLGQNIGGGKNHHADDKHAQEKHGAQGGVVGGNIVQAGAGLELPEDVGETGLGDDLAP